MTSSERVRKMLLSTTLPPWCVRAILSEAYDHGHSAGQDEIDNLAASMLYDFEMYLNSKDKLPGLVTVEIWQEGYAATGGSSPATLLGTMQVEWGTTFDRALDTYFCLHPHPNWEPATRTVWGCRLFPTRTEAAASFG